MNAPGEPEFPACPLCGGAARAYATVASGRYGRCPDCRLVFQHPAEWPSREAELDYYRTHENDPADAGYRRFLSRLAEPLSERLPSGAAGLDYGCGPGPALSSLMGERGFAMTDYDPLFFPDDSALARQWDFITCTETVEHFHHPAGEFRRLDGLLKPGGLLGIMTEPRDPERSFEAWWYHRDPTHVGFYEPFTLQWIGKRFGWEVEFPSRTVAIFTKGTGSPDHGTVED